MISSKIWRGHILIAQLHGINVEDLSFNGYGVDLGKSNIVSTTNITYKHIYACIAQLDA
jgi:hypothetical protein